MEFKQEEEELVKNLLDKFKEKDIEFVVPRGYQNLPKSILGGDIDIYVYHSDFNKAIKIAKNVGYLKKKQNRIKDLIFFAIDKPLDVIKILIKNPYKAIKILFSTILDINVNKPNSDYTEWKGYYGDIIVHLMNHLAYESPMDGSMRRVDIEVEKSFFENARLVDGIPVPSKPDELAHLICRGVFSYKGDFPSYYLEWCKNLSDDVLSSTDKKEHLKRLFSSLFYKADIVVLESIRENDYCNLKKGLRKYSGY